MRPEELVNGMSMETPRPKDETSDTIPGNQPELQIDKDDLANCIITDLKNDIADKEDYGWLDKRAYDIKAYYGLKDEAMMNWPHPNASAFPQPLTPTLLDTGHSNTLASMYSNSDKLVRVKGIGVEDIRRASMVEGVMNFKLSNQVDMYAIQDANIFLSYLHGTNFIKVMQDFDKNRIRPVSVRAENCFMPVDASGVQVDDTDHFIQMVPLTANDIEFRKSLKIGGKAVYDGIGDIPVGWRVGTSGSDMLAQHADSALGTSVAQRLNRDMYFMAEVYKSYYPKNGVGQYSSVRMGKPMELIVWISPNGGKILRVMENKLLNSENTPVRPFSKYTPYPNPGRAWGMSLPEKIRNIQEKLDYADKQNTDALDRAIAPAMFVDSDSTFDPNVYQRVPMGIYPLPKGTNIQYEPSPPVERGFERQLDYLWELAERLTGLTDVAQGRAATKTKTLGEAQIRTQRSDIRFSTIFDRFDKGWKETMRLVYMYISKYTPPDEKVRIIGYNDYVTIEEIFPQGIQGNYDFSFGGTPISDVERQKEDTLLWCQEQMSDPNVIQNPANWWRIKKLSAEARGIKNVEEYLTEPKGASVQSAKEVIQRILGGQYDVTPRPEIDAENYILEINLFMKTAMYQYLDPKGKFTLQRLLGRVSKIAEAKRQADMDVMLAQRQQMDQQMIEQDISQDLEKVGGRGSPSRLAIQ